MIRNARLARLSRRRVLKGMLNGVAVTVGLPLLDCLLNDGGSALASGAPLPLRFVTWFWGLGGASSVFVPKKSGADFDLPEELQPLARVRQHVNVYTNFNAFRDSAPNLCHYTGWIVCRSGIAPIASEDKPGETIDVTIARTIGRSSRFPTVMVTANGDMRTSFSYENANSVNAAEPSPLNLYTRIFGPGYQDPNAEGFTPSALVMARKSVLSGVLDQTREEPIDKVAGYQTVASWFTRRAMEEWAYFVEAFAKVREGDGTLLDNTLIYASTDSNWARIHSIDGIPMFTAGRAGGRVRTGLHVDGGGTAATRVGYTAMKVFGVEAASWGSKSNGTSSEVSEILA
jgi:hypothetical protein